jgi:hypothetical protein
VPQPVSLLPCDGSVNTGLRTMTCAPALLAGKDDEECWYDVKDDSLA